MTRHARWIRLASAPLVCLTLFGCGRDADNGGTGDRCPTAAEVDEMTSEELNAIPSSCDEHVPVPADEPGVSDER